MSRPKRVFENQRLFTPNVVRRFTNSTGVVRKQTASSMSGSAPTSTTGSFRFDAPGTPLKSTQQLPIDFSAWENHTFFSSAESNVNIIFEKIINNFPFDGTREDYETWLDDLSGWEKYFIQKSTRAGFIYCILESLRFRMCRLPTAKSMAPCGQRLWVGPLWVGVSTNCG